MPRKTRAERGAAVFLSSSFNEAAARCHGKRPDHPRHVSHGRSFNEAAARCHGKRAAPPPCGPATGGFNEAAARCHGKHATIGYGHLIVAELQ